MRHKLVVILCSVPLLVVLGDKTIRSKLFSWFGRSPSKVSRPLDLLTASAGDLQLLMKDHYTTSAEIIRKCFNQIERYDGYLKAVITTNSKAIEQAAHSDLERARGFVRSSLHGIPDNIETGPDLKMSTTAGSYALLRSEAYAAAPVVDMLTNAGAVVIGKAQLSEFALYKGSDLPSGWSALRGQCQSPYTVGDVEQDGPLGHSNPGGSSTGSAVGVAAGYAPISIGTDTTGSVIIPATRAALYGMRITPSRIAMQGIVPLSKAFDSIGIMAKTAGDIQSMLEVLLPDETAHDAMPYKPWSKLRIGAVAPEQWKFDDSLQKPNPAAERQIITDTRTAYKTIELLTASFKEIDLSLPNEIEDGLSELFRNDFEPDLNGYLESLKSSKVRSLQAIIEFNKEHAAQELPAGYSKQDLLEDAVGYSLGKRQRDKLFSQIEHKCHRDGIDKVMEENQLDVIIGPADSAFNLLVCGGGYPSATMPLSYLSYNDRPIGVFAIGRRNDEKILLQVMKAWEQTFPARKIPNHMRDDSSS